MINKKNKSLNVWIVNPYGTLPSEGWKEYRSAMLAKVLAENGHNVTWWISDFVHRSKEYRPSGQINDPLLPNKVKVISVHARKYLKNISLGRIMYEKSFGLNFEKLARNEVSPDLIVLGDPSLFYMGNVLRYKRKSNCRLIVDVIDLWPELFNVIFPLKFRGITDYFWTGFYRRRRKLIESSDGVVAVSNDYLKTALKNVSNNIKGLVVYWGYVKEKKSNQMNVTLVSKLEDFSKSHKNILVYAGSLGDAYDMDIIINAIKKASDEKANFGFLIAGDGPRKDDFIKLQDSHGSHFRFLGAVHPSDLELIYEYSDLGLITYVEGSTVAMPIKLFDYLSAGLAILNSLGRDIGEIVEMENIGKNYKSSDVDDFIVKIKSIFSDASELNMLKRNSFGLSAKYNSNVQYLNFTKFIESVCRA